MNAKEIVNRLQTIAKKRIKMEAMVKRLQKKIIKAREEESAHAEIILAMCHQEDESETQPEISFWKTIKIDNGSLICFGHELPVSEEDNEALRPFIELQTDSIKQTVHTRIVLGNLGLGHMSEDIPEDKNFVRYTVDHIIASCNCGLETYGIPFVIRTIDKQVTLCPAPWLSETDRANSDKL